MGDTTLQSESSFSNATKTFAKTLQDQLGSIKTQVSVKTQSSLPEDTLREQDVFLKLRNHVGFPSYMDSLAYDPKKKLLAVGTSLGRIKVIGSDGVECLLSDESSSDGHEDREDTGTIYLGFLKNRNDILCVSRNGKVQLFGLEEQGAVLDTTDVFRDRRGQGQHVEVIDVSFVPGGSYMIIGCSDGNSLVIHVGKEISVKPYRIFADDLEASGNLICIDSTLTGDRPFILFVYKESEAIVYDIRAERVLCTTPLRKRTKSGQIPTCACWVGKKGNCFAVGYSDGSISIWGISTTAVKRIGPKHAGVEEVVLVLDISPSQSRQACSAIKSMEFMQGGKGTPQEKDCLLVMGGQVKGEPDMLSLVSLEPEGQHQDDIIMIPWFGEIISYSIMESELNSGPGISDRVMILTEGGQLVVHDLTTWEPLPVSLKFQELPPFSCSAFMPSIPDGGAHSPCLKNLRYLSWKHVEDTKWPFNGGIPPSNYFISESEYLSGGYQEEVTHPSGVLLFGHRDGRIRVWDATSAVPKHMTTVPQSLDILSDEGRLMAVTCFDVCPISGILAVGHAGGQVRIYQFSTSAQSVRRVSLDGSKLPYDVQIDQNPGWQYILKYSCHAGNDISALCLASRRGLLAIGDESGNISLLDIKSPQKKLEHTLKAGISRIKISMIDDESAGDVKHCMFCLARDCSLDIVDCESGSSLLPKPLRPKNESFPLNLTLLNGDGCSLPPLSGEVELDWADNNAISRPRTVGMTKLSNFSQGRRLGDALEGNAAENLLEEDRSRADFSADSEFDDINTDADLWSAVPPTMSQRNERYPNDSFYSGYLKRNAKTSCNMLSIASSDSLRLYIVDSIVKGERSPSRKVRLPSDINFCSSFHSVSGSGIITASSSVSCYSLPGLTKVGKTIDNYLITNHMQHCPWSVSLDGQLLVSSPTNELLRYSSLVRAPIPLAPEKIVTSIDSQSIRSSVESNGTRDRDDKVNPAIQGISNILGTVKGAANAASGRMMHEIEKASGHHDLPSVREIFQKKVSALDEDIKVDSSDDDGPSMSAGKSSVTMRKELLGARTKGTSKSPNAKITKRTASSVKRHYAAQNNATSAMSVMQNTRNLLAERGKKLENLQEKSEAMQNEAEDFASMAQELEKAFANKKWYQI